MLTAQHCAQRFDVGFVERNRMVFGVARYELNETSVAIFEQNPASSKLERMPQRACHARRDSVRADDLGDFADKFCKLFGVVTTLRKESVLDRGLDLTLHRIKRKSNDYEGHHLYRRLEFGGGQ